MTLADIEQAKNTASWLNSLSVAVATAGAIAPLFNFLFDLAARLDVWILIAVGFVCFVIAWILHAVGDEIVGEIR